MANGARDGLLRQIIVSSEKLEEEKKIVQKGRRIFRIEITRRLLTSTGRLIKSTRS